MSITFFKRLQINEALNNPVKYYLTDDTVLPKRLYGAFEIDGMKYVMVMAQSKIPNVYYMELGRVKEGSSKVMWWKFHSPKHIIPALATLVSFSDSSLELLGKDKFKGVAIKLRKAAATKSLDRAINIASRVIKTKFNTRLQMLPVSQETTGNQYGDKFIFVARKGQSYVSMFAGDKHFAGYDFGETPAVSADDLEIAVKPKQVIKQTATTKPSTKYTFGQFDVDVPGDIDSEMLQRLQNVKASDATNTAKEKPAKSTTPITDAYTEKLNAIPSNTASSKAAIIESLPSMKSMVNALKKYGFDQNKLNWGDLKYVISNANKVEKALLEKAGLLSVDGAGQKVLWMSVMKKIAAPSVLQTIKGKVQTVKTLVKDFYLDYPNGKPDTVKPVPVSSGSTPIKGTKTANVKPTEFTSTIPGSSTTEVTPSIEPPYWGTNENVQKQTQYIFYDLGYDEELKKIPNFRSMVSYTGNQYSSYNNPARNVVGKLLKGQDLYAPEITNIVKNTSKFMRLAKMFDKVKPLPEGIWVYRGTYIPNNLRDQVEPGFQYADPAFLSTTLRSNLGFGSDKMRIYLPKGSKVLPVLSYSKHSSEKEIILPPSSIIKTLEVTRFDNSNKIYMQGIFMGTAYKSIVEELKKQLTKLSEHITMYQALQLVRLFEQMNKETEYDPEEKYGGSYDAELAELINKKIESGEYKVERPKVDNEN